MLSSPASNVTLFLATEGGGFAWMDVNVVLASRLIAASETVIRYGYRSVCLEDPGSVQFPCLHQVERSIHVGAGTFWIEAHSLASGEHDRTRVVRVSEIRKATQSLLSGHRASYFLQGSEQPFQDYIRSMQSYERECLFGVAVADQLAQDFSLQRIDEVEHG